VGSVYPTYLSINYSILMVIWVAAGGLATPWGPVIGAIVLNACGTFFSENLPDFWWFVLGGALILIVFLFPKGMVGLKPRLDSFLGRLLSTMGRGRAAKGGNNGLHQ
jgi:urea transport system permease protein